MQREGEITFTGKPKVHTGVKAPSQALTDAVIPGDHDQDNASER
ncbi:hypothetical protein GCM10022380_89240 [Amycolatopsis tucumanensis]|uniref:Uncharacterized protein n=1 Tax=Amycolatopsis tucumanensis TaxID=401106 RepID=A0ABP7JXW4_9PSEU